MLRIPRFLWALFWLIAAGNVSFAILNALERDWAMAATQAAVLCWMLTWAQARVLIARLLESCGTGRPADRIEVRDGVTVRYWYTRSPRP